MLGHDLTEIKATRQIWSRELAAVELLQKVTGAIMGMGKPVLLWPSRGMPWGQDAAVMNCDLILAAEGKPRFSRDPHRICGSERSYKPLPLIIGMARAKEMIMLGTRIHADQADKVVRWSTGSYLLTACSTKP